jgi:hypothetical protein
MEMEMGTSLQQMMAHLLADINSEAEARQQRAEARQEKMNAEMKASQERATAEIKAAFAEMEAEAKVRHERFLAFLNGLTFYGEGTTTC